MLKSTDCKVYHTVRRAKKATVADFTAFSIFDNLISNLLSKLIRFFEKVRLSDVK